MLEHASLMESRPAGQRPALIGIATSQLLVLTLWFSAAAVAPQLRLAWDLAIAAATSLTLAVQVGFMIAAAFGSQWGFPWLAIGPALGIAAMTKLRSSKTVQLAT